ncbi:MAG: heme ABC transporter ATP-binding protein [Verrucomicrobiota bacterium]
MIVADGVKVRRGGKELLQGVNVEVHVGEFFVVLGPNGAGKSTFIKTLTGEIEPSAGTVQLGGKKLADWDPVVLGKIRGHLPQNSDMAFPFSVMEIVLFGRIPHYQWFESSEDMKIANEALALVGMEQFANRKYLTLSGGEQQRVQLARVVAQIWDKPADHKRYLLLDEPTSSLDVVHQEHVLHLVKKLTGQDIAVLAILHDINQACKYADQILFIKGGKQVAYGSVDQTLKKEVIEEVYDMEVTLISHPKREGLLVLT